MVVKLPSVGTITYRVNPEEVRSIEVNSRSVKIRYKQDSDFISATFQTPDAAEAWADECGILINKTTDGMVEVKFKIGVTKPLTDADEPEPIDPNK